MASANDPSDRANTLPRPDLNPLLNPLLANNMGRWAEVYFTAAPEKREEAVLELLRELEARGSNGLHTTANAPTNAQTRVAPAVLRNPQTEVSSEFTEPEHQQLTQCGTCGHDNPPSHQFCGMCGEKLVRSAAAVPHNGDRHEGSEGNDFDEQQSMSNSPRSDCAEVIEPARVSDDQPANVDSASPSSTSLDELTLFRNISRGSSNPTDAGWKDSGSRSRPSRVFIGVVLVVLIALGYMAWRKTRATQSSHEVSPPPPAVAQEAGPAAPATAPIAPGSLAPQSPQAAVPQPTPASTTGAASASSTHSNATDTVKSDKKSAIPASTPEGVSDKSQPISVGNGDEEFRIAQRYLSGGPNLAPNSAEAAPWLWKAVGKHNGPAMLVLADLYLKGNGVAKNCDQARVLLDSAARKGIAGAGERLRNLQAFGCQ